MRSQQSIGIELTAYSEHFSQRIGQFIVNAFLDGTENLTERDLFHVSDEDLLDAARAYVRKYNKDST